MQIYYFFNNVHAKNIQLSQLLFNNSIKYTNKRGETPVFRKKMIYLQVEIYLSKGLLMRAHKQEPKYVYIQKSLSWQEKKKTYS